jgi:hypothetical protein
MSVRYPDHGERQTGRQSHRGSGPDRSGATACAALESPPDWSQAVAAVWRMGVADYEAALVRAAATLVELAPLEGRPIVALWEPGQSAAMERAGRVVHEEAILNLIVADLTG